MSETSAGWEDQRRNENEPRETRGRWVEISTTDLRGSRRKRGEEKEKSGAAKQKRTENES